MTGPHMAVFYAVLRRNTTPHNASQRLPKSSGAAGSEQRP